ncbi:MAG: response regulator [Bacteroidales bacterium]
MKEKTILIVDDSYQNRFLITELLDRSNYKVWSAFDARDAFMLLEKGLPDLIILDIILPGMDGFEFLKILKSHSGYRDIPVIVLSALSGSEDKALVKMLGANRFIAKPLVVNQLYDIVEEVFCEVNKS